MSNAYISIPGESEKLQSYRNTIGGVPVDSEAVTPTDPNGNPYISTNPFPVKLADGLNIGIYDFISLSNYTTDNQPQTVTFKTGGSGGTTVATLTLAYSLGAAGGNLTSVTKS